MIVELREYVAREGAARRVHERFRTIALPLFARHDIEVTGFWTDAADPDRIVYTVQFPDAQAQAAAWAAFQADPEWARAKAASEVDGPIIAEMTSRALVGVDYWPRPSTPPHEGG